MIIDEPRGCSLPVRCAAMASLLCFACVGPPTVEQQSAGATADAWAPTARWDAEEEDLFARWIETLGRARATGACSTLQSCLRTPDANILFDEEDAELHLFADCADLPYIARAYFSYKRRLPFSFASEISGGRYTSGNRVIARSSPADYPSLSALTRGLSETVHSGFFRTAPEVEDSDFYAIDVTPETVRPGTVFYDPNGHVLMVYAVEDDGTVRMIDGHPDNSLTVQRFGQAFVRGSARQGGGFRGWRSQWREADGRIALERNEDCPGFDAAAQYLPSYEVGGQTVDYYAWVRSRLSVAGSRIDPVRELGEQLDAICGAARDRVTAVQAAITDGIGRSNHPDSLPRNIYGTDGEWEVYSTPSRDARLKAQIRQAHAFVTGALELDDPNLDWSGTADDLRLRLVAVWQRAVESCSIGYLRSDGRTILLDLADVMDRLFQLSFDPYHCPELRWGASADELSSCPDDLEKRDWYAAERRLRNVIDRDYERATTLDWGPEQPPDIHLGRLLEAP